MNTEFFTALELLEKEKGIPADYMIEKIEAALISAYKKEYGNNTNVRILIDPAKKDVRVYQQKEVVEEVENPETQISLADAKAKVILGMNLNAYVVLVSILLIMVLLGCFMDMAPLILIMTPILSPICITQLGMHPVHFGVMLIFNLAIGLCTPPVGSALFVGCAIGKTKIEKTSKNMLPMYAVMVLMLLLVTFIPAISMTVPNLMN